MESMDQSRTSEVQRDARIGEAECNRQVFDERPCGLIMIGMNMVMNITVIIKIIIILMTTKRTRSKCPGTA